MFTAYTKKPNKLSKYIHFEHFTGYNSIVILSFFMMISNFNINLSAQSDRNLLFGLHAGFNYSLFRAGNQSIAISNIGSNDDNPETTNHSFFGNTALQFGINLVQPLNDVLALELAPEQFNMRTRFNTFETIHGNTSFEITREISTRAQYYRFPLSLIYWKREGQIQPYAFIGFSYGFLTNSGNASIEKISTTLPDGSVRNTSSNDETTSTQSYVKSRFDLLGGLGVMYEFDRFLIGMDVRLNYLLNNLANTGNRYQSANGLGSGENFKFHSPAVEVKILFNMDTSGNRFGPLDCVFGPY